MATEFTTEQVAKYHGVTVEAVRHWVRAGRLVPLRRVGLLTYVFRAADVRAFRPRKAGRPPGTKDRKKRPPRSKTAT